MLALTLLSLGARHAWLLDLLTFARQHLLFAAAALVPAAWLAGSRPGAIAAAAAVAVNLTLLLPPAAAPALPSPTAPVPLRVLSLNLLNQNYYANRVQRFLRRSGADVILVQELAEFTGEKLAGLRDLYPYAWPALSPPGGDIAVLSKRPLQEVERLEPPPAAVDSPRGRPLRLLVDGVAIYAVHPDTPRSPASWRRRNALLDWLGRTISTRDGDRPSIVAGDFNTPPGSPFLVAFERAAGLRDAAGAGLRRPTRQPLLLAPYLAPLGAPVDHVLVSPGIAVAAFAVGRDVESDHLPIIADLLLPRAAQPAIASPAR